MGGKKDSALPDEGAGFGKFFVGQGGVKADDHEIRLFVHQPDACLGKTFHQRGRAHQIDRLVRAVGQQVADGHIAAGHDLVSGNGTAHAFQLCHIVPGGAGGVVGEKQILLPCCLYRLQKLCRAGQDALAQIKGAVHIQHKQPGAF